LAERRQAKLDRRARIEAVLAKERARKRRVRFAWLGAGGVVVVVVAAIVAVAVSGGSAGHEPQWPGGPGARP
jgi:hypothetical protein